MSYTDTTPAATQGIIDSHIAGREAAGSAPTITQVKREHRNMVIGLTAAGLALAVLVTLVTIRVFELALPLSYGAGFAALLAVFVGLCFVLITVLLVYGYSRGNLLGEDLAQSAAAVEEIEAEHERLTAEAEEQVSLALEQTEEARLMLDQVDDIRLSRVATALEGAQAAATVLGVTELPSIPPESLNRIPTKVREGAEARIATAEETAAALLTEARGRTLTEITRPIDAHENVHAQHLGVIDYSAADETTVPTAPRPSRGWLLPVVVAVAALVVVGAVLALAFGPLAAVAAEPATSSSGSAPTDASAAGSAVEGEDYAFQAAGPDGSPVHWSCDRPIGVALDGTQPPGADAVLSEAVAIIAGASGLPVQVVPAGGDISVGYASGAEFDAVSGSDTAIGVADSRWDVLTGLIQSSAITIDSAAAANAVDAPLAPWVVAHELAHAVGLDHAEDPTELMSPTISTALTGLGDGDRIALAVVGC